MRQLARFEFMKWHGAGNDFVIVDCFKETVAQYAETAIAVCDRHFGVGADGLVLLLPSEKADFRMRIFNLDGSEAEMCGNATRCVAKYAYETGLVKRAQIEMETKAGIIRPEVELDAVGKVERVRVNMGRPILAAEEIPVQGFGRQQVVNAPLTVLGQTYAVTCVSMGNPHCVIFVDDISTVALEKIGPIIETHEWFPKKTNVEFAQVLSESEIRMRVWERGAAITMACGTGSCATLVAAALNKLTKRKASLALDGGRLEIEWSEADDCVYMAGPATLVFTGVYGA